MKFSQILSLALPLTFVSCMAPIQNQQNEGGTYSDPNNPYAVPGVSTQGGYAPASQAPYDQTAASAPYQSIPSTSINPPANIPSTPAYTPPPAASSTPSRSGGNSHTVASGDTLWGLSQKYGVSVDDIRQANGISGNTIVTGQTISIPR